jgi:hypothetical protein
MAPSKYASYLGEFCEQDQHQSFKKAPYLMPK